MNSLQIGNTEWLENRLHHSYFSHSFTFAPIAELKCTCTYPPAVQANPDPQFLSGRDWNWSTAFLATVSWPMLFTQHPARFQGWAKVSAKDAKGYSSNSLSDYGDYILSSPAAASPQSTPLTSFTMSPRHIFRLGTIQNPYWICPKSRDPKSSMVYILL